MTPPTVKNRGGKKFKGKPNKRKKRRISLALAKTKELKKERLMPTYGVPVRKKGETRRRLAKRKGDDGQSLQAKEGSE